MGGGGGALGNCGVGMLPDGGAGSIDGGIGGAPGHAGGGVGKPHGAPMAPGGGGIHGALGGGGGFQAMGGTPVGWMGGGASPGGTPEASSDMVNQIDAQALPFHVARYVIYSTLDERTPPA